MTPRRFAFTGLVTCALVALAACSPGRPDDSEDENSSDAGAATGSGDAAVRPDAGRSRDAGARRDAGVVPDAGEVVEDGGEPDAGIIAPAGVPLEEFGTRFPREVCARYSRCYSIVEAICPAAMGTIFELKMELRSVADGRSTYDAAVGAACLKALEEVPCDRYGDLLPAICENQMFLGRIATGGSCWSPTDCANGYCAGLGQSCPGTCATWAAPGESCGSGAYCNPHEGFACIDGSCAPRGVVGAPCQDTFDCREGTHCSTAATCVTDRRTGESCAFTGECELGLFCLGLGDGTRVCAPQVGSGGVCGADAQHAASRDECASSLVCQKSISVDTPRVCVLPASDGGTCVTGGYPVGGANGCLSGAICSEGTCHSAPGPGEPCATAGTADFSCRPDTAVCVGGRCVALAPDGAACTHEWSCQSRRCVQNKCVPPPGPVCLPE